MKTPVGINVGASKEAITELGKVVLSILKTRECDEMTKVSAIDAVTRTVHIENVAISGCHIQQGSR